LVRGETAYLPGLEISHAEDVAVSASLEGMRGRSQLANEKSACRRQSHHFLDPIWNSGLKRLHQPSGIATLLQLNRNSPAKPVFQLSPGSQTNDAFPRKSSACDSP
jgi:hypothetical protein